MYYKDEMVFRKNKMADWLKEKGIDASKYLNDMNLLDGKVAQKNRWKAMVEDKIEYYIPNPKGDGVDYPVLPDWCE